ncbi:unnamed protein product [Amoebophrya sp. A25]|nr:unnamed protein product [Amoebophrya sp. A25]|eukprot:GSA25T00019389001.1
MPAAEVAAEVEEGCSQPSSSNSGGSQVELPSSSSNSGGSQVEKGVGPPRGQGQNNEGDRAHDIKLQQLKKNELPPDGRTQEPASSSSSQKRRVVGLVRRKEKKALERRLREARQELHQARLQDSQKGAPEHNELMKRLAKAFGISESFITTALKKMTENGLDPDRPEHIAGAVGFLHQVREAAAEEARRFAVEQETQLHIALGEDLAFRTDGSVEKMEQEADILRRLQDMNMILAGSLLDLMQALDEHPYACDALSVVARALLETHDFLLTEKLQHLEPKLRALAKFLVQLQELLASQLPVELFKETKPVQRILRLLLGLLKKHGYHKGTEAQPQEEEEHDQSSGRVEELERLRPRLEELLKLLEDSVLELPPLDDPEQQEQLMRKHARALSSLNELRTLLPSQEYNELLPKLVASLQHLREVLQNGPQQPERRCQES